VTTQLQLINIIIIIIIIIIVLHTLFLGAFAKLLPHVCPSVRMEQLGSHWTDFHEI